MSKSFNQGCIVPPVFTHYFSGFCMENPLLFSKGSWLPGTGGPPKCAVCKVAQNIEETKERRKNFFTDKQSYMLLVTTGSKHYSGRKIFFKLTERLPSIVPSRAQSKHAASAREALSTYSRMDGARQSGSLTKAQWAGALFPCTRINTSALQSFTATCQSKHQIDCTISERWPKLTDIFHAIPWNNPVLSLAQMWKYVQWRKERLVLESFRKEHKQKRVLAWPGIILIPVKAMPGLSAGVQDQSHPTQSITLCFQVRLTDSHNA